MKVILIAWLCVFLVACLEQQDEQQKDQTEAVEDSLQIKACSKELKLCPDGSGVSRSPENNCEFDACPENTSKVSQGKEVLCTQDVKQCPDGTFVGRNPELNCTFKPCPDGNSDVDDQHL